MDKLHFINPEYLWGLLFLAIPIIVHLFNFRKAKVVFFTRVDLLKEIKTKKRNFSTFKKRLILASRLLAIFFFVLATSSPYLSDVSLRNKSNRATFLYLDNSFSMQSKSSNSTLMELAKKKIKESYSYFSDASQIYLLSNNSFIDVNSENELMVELSKIKFSYEEFSTLKVKSRVYNLAERNLISDYSTIVFSDFKEGETVGDSLFSEVKISRVNLGEESTNNVSLDSLWLKSVNVSENKFTVAYKIFNYGSNDVEVNESFKFDGRIQQSLTRSVKQESDTVFSIRLELPNSKKGSGVVSIKDGSVWYDNDLYFSVDFSKKSKVLFVGDKSSKRLSKILNDDFVQLQSTSHSSFNIQNLNNFDFVIYSIGKVYKPSEIDLLKEFLGKGKEILLVPSSTTSSNAYNKVLSELKIGRVVKYSPKEIAVTDINYQDSFFEGVFNSRVDNFEYPILENSFSVKVSKSESLLSFESGRPFLLKSKNVYLFTSSIFGGEKPFVNNDLALPVLYKMASSNLQRSLYYTVGKKIRILEEEQDLKLGVNEEKVSLNKISLNEYELPQVSKSGNYNLYSEDKLLKKISFNYDRTESKLIKNNIELTVENRNYQELKNQSNVNYLWKWCITFALIFMIVEMLLISFLKDN